MNDWVLEGHISKAFDGALATLHLHVIAMGGLVQDQVNEALRAYTDWDPAPAELVIEREAEVNTYNTDLDTEQLTLLARRQPLAGDLRAVLAMSKIVAELERAGDEAKKIARAVLVKESRPGPGTARDARHLGSLAISLLRLSLEALDRLDMTLCDEVIDKDKDLDAEYAAGLRRLLSRAMEDPRHFDVAIQAAFVLKSLERIGDHARNVARHVQNIALENVPASRP